MLKENTEVVMNVIEDTKFLEHLRGRTCGDIRSVLLLLGGGMNMAFSWGVVNAFTHIGLMNFDVVVGVSAGALVGSYFVAGQASLGASLYCNELASRRFVRYFKRNILDLDYGEELMRQGKYSINTNAILCSSSNLYLALTSWKSAKGLLLRAKSTGIDIVTAVKAAVAPPGIYNEPLYPLPGERYVDGAIAFPFPLQEVMRFNPTHLVVVANHSFNTLPRRPPLTEQLFLLLRTPAPAHLKKAMFLRYARFRKSYRALRRLNINTYIFTPSETAHMLIRNRVKLYNAFDQTQRAISRRFSQQL